jgi:tRNA pseudouridine38-40 synthase
MQRYFIELAYKGTEYSGWQKQPHKMSVQEMLEDCLNTILNAQVEVTGCGRTDAGVHARQYFAHFNYAGEFPKGFERRLNKFLPHDIAVHRIFPVHWDAHARFDAYSRSYAYDLHFRKDPFSRHLATAYQLPQKPDPDHMQAAANVLLQYKDFAPFCKTNHDAKTMTCLLSRSEWVFHTDGQSATYHISANRFLRGMVRLIVGMCINVGTDKLNLEEVKLALEQQSPLRKSTSAAPDGLYLEQIRYPYLNERGVYTGPPASPNFQPPQ